MSISIVLVLLALIFGILGAAQVGGRLGWAGLGVVCMALAALIGGL